MRPSLHELTLYFLKLGATGFGGPVALANYMRHDLVDRAGWISEEEYERGLAIATICPGPMAYQLGVYCGYITHGIAGGVAVAVAFAIAPFAIVTLVAAIYVEYAGAQVVRGLFYGIGPVVAALILRACWNLGTKTLKRDLAAWAIALVGMAATVLLQRELIVLFLAAGAVGAFVFAPTPILAGAAAPQRPLSVRGLAFGAVLAVVPAAMQPVVWDLFAFFFRTSLLVFGSGLVIVSFVKAYVVDEHHWLTNQAFIDAVAVGMVSPGPVVITATFIGYLVAG